MKSGLDRALRQTGYFRDLLIRKIAPVTQHRHHAIVLGQLLERPLDDRLLLMIERDRLVQEAVASLTEPYRETIVLRYFGELSIAEIASQTGRPIGTVKTHLGRGLIRLRPALAEVRLT